ncbi:MAG: hypothetical protein K0U23_08855 [Gammaproteobacteria bacterium]|nr:hypothetical protein [Gammaproteobacteria bacterium]
MDDPNEFLDYYQSPNATLVWRFLLMETLIFVSMGGYETTRSTEAFISY